MAKIEINKFVNTIICGDCLDILKEFPDSCVDLVLTDPPYNEVNRPNSGLRSFDKGIADSLEVDIPIVAKILDKLCRGSIYVWCGTEQVSFWRREFVSFGLSTRQCIWEKTNPSPINGQYLWLSNIENCIFAKKPRATFTHICDGAVWRAPTERRQIHPTQKPLYLMTYLINASSRPNELVLDPFCGSGTTCVAAKMLGRRYIGIDISSDYCEIARQRLEAVDTGVPVKEQRAGQMALEFE
ncbi:MAG TPA: site-specific DNA-methyltransferase [Williamwhitmania sp.]|nr:site-specific DNA-methyltransferase [Williamwhitmania sp.]